MKILQDKASGVVGGRTPTVTFRITADFQDLNSVGPTSDEALRVPLGKLLVKNGVATQDQVDASERGAAEGIELPGEGIEDFGAADNGQFDGLSVLDQQEESAQDSVDEGSEIQVPVSIQFEN